MLTKARLIVLVVLFAVVVAAFTTYALLPRRYQIREQLTGIDVFWHEDEAFVFVDHHAMGRSTNAVLERLPQSGWWGSMATISADWRGFGQTTSAYRLGGSALDRYELPNTVMAPSWDLEEGRLVARARIPAAEGQGFRWTGSGFVRLPARETAPMASAGARTLQADDQDEDEDQARGFGPVPAEARERLKNAGWHFKHLSGYEGVRGPVALPIALRAGTCSLSLRSEKRAEGMFPFMTAVELAGERLSPHAQVLFQDAGWKEIPRGDFEARSAGTVGSSSFPTSMLLLLVVWLGFLVLKVGGVASFLPFVGLRRRLVKSVATTMSFPPAIPEQFPRLDRPKLEAFSRDLEGLGFEKLLDTAPVADSPTYPPSFCRIYAHRRQACFGVIMQSFPAIGGPIDLRCMLNGYLDDGWSVGAGNGKPLAASAFVRLPRAIGVSLPGAPPAELLARVLQFRDRVCADLGLRPITDTSLESYIRRTLENLAEIREAMKKRSMAVGLGQYYSRMLGLQRKAQLVWLGDYPKIAEERKAAGLGPGFSGSAMFE
jgi:hypothetical protein